MCVGNVIRVSEHTTAQTETHVALFPDSGKTHVLVFGRRNLSCPGLLSLAVWGAGHVDCVAGFGSYHSSGEPNVQCKCKHHA